MGRPKQLLELLGKPVAAWSLETLARCPSVTSIIIASEPEELGAFRRLAASVGEGKVERVVAGGARRQDSVFAALRAMDRATDLVVVHDGARPFVTASVVARVIEKARECGGAIAAVPVKDTIKQATESGVVLKTISRERLWAAQTPQAFGYELLVRAHERAEIDGFMGTDDAELVERLGGVAIAIVEGSYENLKITTPEDMVIAERIATRLAGNVATDL